MAPKASTRAVPKGFWCLTVNNPTVEDLKALWVFNQPNGPVPENHPLGAIIIGWEHFSQCDQQAGLTPHLQVYLELKNSTVGGNTKINPVCSRVALNFSQFGGGQWPPPSRRIQRSTFRNLDVLYGYLVDWFRL